MRSYIILLSFIMLMVTIMAAPVNDKNYSFSVKEVAADFEPTVEVNRYTRDTSAESKEQSSEESEGSGEVNRYTRDTSAESKEQSSEESEGSGEQSDRLRRDASSSEEEGSGADKDTDAELVAAKVTFM